MLIGIDASRAVSSQRTGTEAYAYFLIRALIPQAQARGFQLRLYFNQPPAPDLFPVVEQDSLRLLPFPRLWTHLRLAWELQHHPPDIFFTPAHVIPYSYFGCSVATVHDLGYHHFPEAHPAGQLRYLKWSTRHNGRRAHTILADSQATKTDLQRFDGVSEAKIKVVYPGVDPALQRVEEPAVVTAVLEKLGVERPYFLFVSTLQPRKNLGRLITAFAESGVPHRLVLAGKTGWLSQPLLNQIDELPPAAAAKIIITGFISDQEKAALLSGAAALLYPSLYEGFGFPILEAQACGTPVLTATTSSCPEAAGSAALLVDPLSTAAIKGGIQQLAAEAALRERLVQQGYENVRRFAWQKTAGQVLDIFESIKGNHRQ